MQNPFGEERPQTHFRVIPEIEKNVRLQTFVATHLGRFVLALLYVFVLLSFGSAREDLQIPWFMLTAVAALALIPGPPLPRLFTGILLAYFSKPDRAFSNVASQREQAVHANEILVKFIDALHFPLLYFGCALIVFGLLAVLCLRALRAIQPRLPVLWLFFIWLVLLSITLQLPVDSVALNMAWLTLGIFSICLFSLAYFHVSRPSRSKSNFLEEMTFGLQTFLITPPFTVVRHPDLLTEKKTPVSMAVCQLKALKLIVWSRLLASVEQGLSYFVFHYLGWLHFNYLGLAEYNQHHFAWYQVLLTRVAQTLIFLLDLSVKTGIGISLFRLAGIYLPRAICRPYLARSFNDYFRRSLYYYSETILQLFFYPIYERLYATVKNRQWRLQIALFLSLLVGGWIFHVVITWQNFFYFGTDATVINALSWLPYFSAIAMACCLSATGWLSHKLRSAPLALHFALNILLHALLMSLFQYSLYDTLADRIQFIRSMWPL